MAEHYTLKTGVIVDSATKRKIKKIADKYYELVSKKIVITSGTRASKSQASAMYGKLSGGDKLTIYKDQVSAQAIKKAYDDGVAKKRSKSQVITDMTDVIDKQIKSGKFISKHLRKGAIDVRSRNMSIKEKAKFKQAAKNIATTIILEVTPPHFHLQL